MSLLTQKDVNDIKAALEEVAEFTEEPIEYHKFISVTPGDPSLGIPEQYEYEADPNVTASVRELTLEEVQVSGGAYILGDMEFTIRMEAVPAYADRIVYNNTTFKPKSISKFWLGEVISWDVRAGKV